MEKLQNNKYLYTLILLSFFLHIISAFYSVGFYSDDEHFQILEITAYLLGINEIAINDPTGYYWEWQEDKRIRPWFQPFIYFQIINFLKIFNLNDPFLWSLFIRLISSILGFFSILYLFYSFKNIFFNRNKIFNYFLFFSFWFYPFLHSRTSAENLSLSIFIISFCILFQILENKNNKYTILNFSFGSFLMGMSMVTKFTTVFTAVPFFLWLVLFKFNKLKIFIFGIFILLALSLGLFIDYVHWGSLKNTYYQFYFHNLSAGETGRMKYFGVDPWYYYIIEIIKQLAPVLSIFFLIGLVYFWINNIKNVFTWITLITLVIFSSIGHKEIRYIFPLYIFAPFFVAYFFEKFSIKFLSNFFKFMIILSNIIFLTITLVTPANSKVGVYNYIYKNINNQYKFYYVDENPYLVNNMEPFFYTSYLPKIENFAEKKGNNQFWITSNNYDSIKKFENKNCNIKYSTYPRSIINLNKNWKRLKINWYILFCN